MLPLTRFLLASPLLLLLVPSARAADEQAVADEQVLRTLSLPTDGPGLVDFFKKRTLRDNDKPKIQAMIRNLGHDDFDTREKAMADLVALGAVAKPLLREALKDKDIEIQRRSETCLALADKTSTPEAMSAAVRQLGRKAVPGASEVLLDFLPFVEDESVVDEFGPALARAGVQDNKPEAVLAAALADTNPMRRAVAAEAVGRAAGKNAELLAAARALLTDADLKVRHRAALGLIVSKDREAVPALINQLAEVDQKQTWRIEEILFNLAGDKAPTVNIPRNDPDGRKKYRDLWATWWKENEAKVDVAKLGAPKPFLGYTLVSYNDLGKAGRNGKVAELDATGKVRWELGDILTPIDAQVLPNGNVLVMEQNGILITERNLKNEILWQKNVNGNAVTAKRLPNGNTFIASRNQIMEVDKDGKDVWVINRNMGDILSAVRLPNGNVAILSSVGQYHLLDNTGKVLKSFAVGNLYYNGTQFEVLPNGHVLVPQYSQSKVVEYDADGKSVWEVNATRPTGVQRLPNGNTLISSRISPIITEVNRAGETIWTHQVAPNARMVRASRR